MIHRHLLMTQAEHFRGAPEHSSGEPELSSRAKDASARAIYCEGSRGPPGRPRKNIGGSFKTDKL
jgi:hypothetical protein